MTLADVKLKTWDKEGLLQGIEQGVWAAVWAVCVWHPPDLRLARLLLVLPRPFPHTPCRPCADGPLICCMQVSR